jgi:hypothetical protein
VKRANYDVQLHIGESRDSGSGPSDHPGMTLRVGRARNRIAGDAIVCSDRHTRMLVMKIVATLLALAALSLAANSADAKGCLKGAAVGGLAGHYAGHHGVLGAAAGCLVGRHRANEQERQQERQQPQQSRGGQAPAGQERM